MKNIISFTIFIFSIYYSQSALAACGLSFTTQNISTTWSLNFSYIAVQIQVSKSDASACDFGIGFTKGGASSYSTRRMEDGTKTLRYQMYKDSGLSKILKDVPDISSVDDVIMGGFQTGANLTQTVNYYFEIPYNLATSPSFVGAGSYIDSVTLNLYEGSDPLAYVTPVDSKTISLTISVNPMIAISLVNSGSSFQTGLVNRNINFGTLSEGQSSSLDFRIRTNAGFSVTFSSTNNGKMKHINSAKNSTIPYSLYVNGSLLNMSTSASAPVVGTSGSGQTSTEGLAFPIKIVVGSTSAAGIVGGTHQDEIIITATTTE